MKRPYRPWTARERQLVVSHYGPKSAEPWPTVRLALALGRGPDDVRAAGRRWGMAHRVITHPTHRQLLRLYAEGLNDCWAAEILGCCREHVMLWRRKHGLPPNRRHFTRNQHARKETA